MCFGCDKTLGEWPIWHGIGCGVGGTAGYEGGDHVSNGIDFYQNVRKAWNNR